MANVPPAEIVVAGAASTLGKIGTVADTAELLVRAPCNAPAPAYNKVLWRVSANQTHDVRFYRARTVVNAASVTFADATRIDDTNTFILNGLTYTAESTATDAAFASRKFYCGGADATADAAEVVKLINADYAVLVDGSVTVGDRLIVTTEEGTYTLIAAAAADYPNGVWTQAGNQAAELASLVLAINNKANVTLATALAGDKLSIKVADDLVPGPPKDYVFTAHATTTTVANREFNIGGATNTLDGDELATCINDSTYGALGLTAVNAAGVVSLTRSARRYRIVGLSSSNATRLACLAAGGVPGVTAVATGATGELSITPTWVRELTVTDTTSAGGATTHITTTDIDIPGVLATSALGVVSLTCSTPGAPAHGEQATVLQFAQGTSASDEAAWASTTKTLLTADDPVNPPFTSVATTAAVAGNLYEQYLDGYSHAYIGVTNKSGGAAATVVVGATPIG